MGVFGWNDSPPQVPGLFRQGRPDAEENKNRTLTSTSQSCLWLGEPAVGKGPGEQRGGAGEGQAVLSGLWELCPTSIVVSDPGRVGRRDRKNGLHLGFSSQGWESDSPPPLAARKKDTPEPSFYTLLRGWLSLDGPKSQCDAGITEALFQTRKRLDTVD